MIERCSRCKQKIEMPVEHEFCQLQSLHVDIKKIKDPKLATKLRQLREQSKFLSAPEPVEKFRKYSEFKQHEIVHDFAPPKAKPKNRTAEAMRGKEGIYGLPKIFQHRSRNGGYYQL